MLIQQTVSAKFITTTTTIIYAIKTNSYCYFSFIASKAIKTLTVITD